MNYDKVRIIFEKDGEEIVKGEVLAREDADLTAEYLIQNFWTIHKALKEEADLDAEIAQAEAEYDQMSDLN